MYKAIFDGVMSHRLAPGTRLPEEALSKLFGVSRTIVRQALRRLAHDHVVELRPRRGAVISSPSPGETRRIFEARQALEAAILPLAMARAGKTDIAALRRRLQHERDALDRSDQSAWARLASRFHIELAALADNAILHGYVVELISRCSLVVALYEPPGHASCEHDEHVHIVDLMERGDVPACLAAMRAHLADLERRISLVHAKGTRTLAQMLGFA
ncbi:MAG: GntR family transcriptional regulator [Rhodospirillaceae bacterium]